MCCISLCQSADPDQGLVLHHVTVIASLVLAAEVRVMEGLEVEAAALREVQAEADQFPELLKEALETPVQIHVRMGIKPFTHRREGRCFVYRSFHHSVIHILNPTVGVSFE